MDDPRPSAPRAIVERFSFRANGREVVEDVDVAPEAPHTLIPPRVAAALGLGPSAGMLVDPDGALSDGAAVGGPTRRCVVAWTLYEAEGYHSRLAVVFRPNLDRPVIGADFLTPHRLSIDAQHRGLVGWAPAGAVPLTGGGYAVNASPDEVRELNWARIEAAQPREVLRPHPAWRYTIPEGVKLAPRPPDGVPEDSPPRAPGPPGNAGRTPGRPRACEFRPPVVVPLAALHDALVTAIRTAAGHTRVDPGCRLHGWRRELETLLQRDRRAVAEETVSGLLDSRARRRAAEAAGAVDAAAEGAGAPAEDGEGAASWEYPSRDAFRSLVEARMFVDVVGRLAPRLRAQDWATLVSGTLRPEADKSTAHRNYLFEFYVAAVAEAAGLPTELAQGPDLQTNPDVIVTVAGERVGIAVKRLGSRTKVLKNAGDAAKQIAEADVTRGLIVLDVSNVINRNAVAIRYLRSPDRPQNGAVLGHLLTFAREHPGLERLLTLPHVSGVVLRNAVPAVQSGSFVPATLESWSPVVERPSDLATEILGRMLDALAPSVVHPSIGLSGYTPCEFAYVHP